VKSRPASSIADLAPTSSGWGVYARSLGNFWKVYRGSRFGVLGLAMLCFFVVEACVASSLAPYPPNQVSQDVLRPPSPMHLLGTNEVGQDILSQVLIGSQASLMVGFAASAISALVGSLVGLIAGYYGGLRDDALMRLTDIFLVIPALPLMVVLAAVIGPSLFSVILAIGVVGWTGTARVVRSQTLSVKELAFIESSRASGGSDFYILFNHVLPNVAPVIFSNTVLVIANAVLSEAVLTFLGLGNPNMISWGQMLQFAFTSGSVTSAWWYVVPPGLSIMLVVLAFSLTGYSLDEVFNPRVRKI